MSLLLVCALSGCAASPKSTAFRPAIKTELGKQAGFSPAESQSISNHCPLGMPIKLKGLGIDIGFTQVIARGGYVLEHSSRDKIPLWVCERIGAEQASGPLTRPKPEPFAPDPQLDKGRRAELKDYKRTGYDRGHQAPSADQTVDRQLQTETYFLSNMCPQFGELNQHIWQALENSVRAMAKTTGPVLVTTGPMFYDVAEDDPKTADGYVEFQTIGTGVAVPTHFYKIVIWQDQQGKWQGAGVVMKNQKQPFPKPYHLNQYVKPIRWIEERTGLNFNPDLPGPDVNRVELQPNPIWN
jgi:endonuclease G